MHSKPTSKTTSNRVNRSGLRLPPKVTRAPSSEYWLTILGIAPDGSSYDKAKEIADIMNDHGNTISNHVNEVKVRFFGETAVAQGSETWEKRNGQLKRGTYVWTDTWVRRNDSWQIVAAEDLLLAESNKK